MIKVVVFLFVLIGLSWAVNVEDSLRIDSLFKAKFEQVNVINNQANGTNSDQGSSDAWSLLFEMAGALIVVVCLIPLSIYLLKRFQNQVKPMVSMKDDIQIVTVKSMGGPQKIAVVKIGSRVLALGMTQHSIRTLADLSPGEYPPADEDRPADQFSKSVDQFLSRFKKQDGLQQQNLENKSQLDSANEKL